MFAGNAFIISAFVRPDLYIYSFVLIFEFFLTVHDERNQTFVTVLFEALSQFYSSPNTTE